MREHAAVALKHDSSSFNLCRLISSCIVIFSFTGECTRNSRGVWKQNTVLHDKAHDSQLGK
jgi:hypothetical protein